jgi:hypothetical protein
MQGCDHLPRISSPVAARVCSAGIRTIERPGSSPTADDICRIFLGQQKEPK